MTTVTLQNPTASFCVVTSVFVIAVSVFFSGKAILGVLLLFLTISTQPKYIPERLLDSTCDRSPS